MKLLMKFHPLMSTLWHIKVKISIITNKKTLNENEKNEKDRAKGNKPKWIYFDESQSSHKKVFDLAERNQRSIHHNSDRLCSSIEFHYGEWSIEVVDPPQNLISFPLILSYSLTSKINIWAQIRLIILFARLIPTRHLQFIYNMNLQLPDLNVLKKWKC